MSKFVYIERKSKTQTMTIALNGNLSDAFDFRDYVTGTIHMPAAWTTAEIGFKVSSEMSGTFVPLYDDATLVTVDVAVDTMVDLGTRLQGCRFVKLWSQNGTGTNVAQAAARSLIVSMKS